MGETERRKRGVVSGDVRGAAVAAANSCLENEDTTPRKLALAGCMAAKTRTRMKNVLTASIYVCIIHCHILFLIDIIRV